MTFSTPLIAPLRPWRVSRWSRRRRRLAEQGRRLLNVLVASVAIVATAPLMAIIVILVGLTSWGPVIYGQPRVGLDRRKRRGPRSENGRRRSNGGGRIFTIYKFRTMVEDSGADQVWASSYDPRVTKVGRLLRATRLDELPQLFNVLKGDMNIVGPRPEQPAIFSSLEREVPHYHKRQRVLPGITGLAQVTFRSDQSLDDVRRKVELDLRYIDQRSALEDLTIMARTMPVMIFGPRGAFDRGSMRRSLLIVGLALGAAAWSGACTMKDITEVPIGSVEVQPSSITILEGETRQLSAKVKDESGKVLPAGTVTWSSDEPSVFTIDSAGNGEALAPGQATIWATVLGTRGSGTVSVQASPSIVVAKPSLLFSGTVGGADPDPLDLQITNGGGGSVGGISATVEYPAGGPTGWISLALAGTSAPTTLTVSSLLGPLEEGTYDATLLLASQDARNSPVAVPVQAVVVLDKPIIGVSSRALEFTMEAGGARAAQQTVQVTNQGGGLLSDLQVVSLYVGVAGWLSAKLTATTAPSQLLVQPDPSGLKPGTYVAELRVIDPEALNTPLSVGVTFTIDVGPLSPASSTAGVTKGTAGRATNIVVQARDGSGNALSSGGATVVITVSGQNPTGPLTATDGGDGTYTASYTPTVTGTDNVGITMNGTPISGSPFTSAVGPGSVSPANSTATVPSGTTDLPTKILVQARDQFGNPLRSGGAAVVVNVSGANSPGALTVTDQHNGTYAASYTPTTAGTDNVAITINGTRISGSPFTSTVGEGRRLSPARSTATVPGGTAGLATNITVQARDEDGNPLPSLGATVVVTVSGQNPTGPVTATDGGDGTYTASYTPTVTGTDNVAITMNGTPISGSPFTSAVGAGSVSPESSTATVPSGRKGRHTDIVVQARDAFGNPLSVGGEVVVVTVSGTNPTDPITATDRGDGTYTARYTPPDRGTDIVAITMNGTPINGSPFTSNVRK